MSATGILINLGWLILHAVVLLLAGAVIEWILTLLGWPPPPLVRKLFLAVVAIYVIVSLLVLVIGGVPVSRVL